MDSRGLQHNLLEHLQQIVRDRDPFLASGAHYLVQQYIHNYFSQWGEVQHHTFEFRGNQFKNLILELPGSDPTKTATPILIGAHYDTVPGTPGADDNASGVAMLLELVRIFAAEKLAYPVRFVAFDLEEMGLIGSQAYVAELKQQQQALRLMFSLEMVGYCDRTPQSQTYPPIIKPFYPNQGNFVALVGNWQIIPDLITLKRSINPFVPCQWLPVIQKGHPLPMTRASDHSPFWDAGYRALMVTDTSFLRNPHYHRESDRLETLDLEFMTNITLGLVNGIRRLNTH
jgi:Zn-dependent M28 family amino/carboxypeptidase